MRRTILIVVCSVIRGRERRELRKEKGETAIPSLRRKNDCETFLRGQKRSRRDEAEGRKGRKKKGEEDRLLAAHLIAQKGKERSPWALSC